MAAQAVVECEEAEARWALMHGGRDVAVAVDLLLQRSEERAAEATAAAGRQAAWEQEAEGADGGDNELLRCLVDEIFVFLDVNGVCEAEETDPVMHCR